jgi:hypothetical protein
MIFTTCPGMQGLSPSEQPACASGAILWGVTATSIRSTWAVGITGRQAVTAGAALADGAVSDEPAVAASAVAETLILRWNGNAWKRVPSPSHATGSGLLGVVATSARNAWAVGLTGPPFERTHETLILRWNGSSWN